jgi:hypothetical protein
LTIYKVKKKKPDKFIITDFPPSGNPFLIMSALMNMLNLRLRLDLLISATYRIIDPDQQKSAAIR